MSLSWSPGVSSVQALNVNFARYIQPELLEDFLRLVTAGSYQLPRRKDGGISMSAVRRFGHLGSPELVRQQHWIKRRVAEFAASRDQGSRPLESYPAPVADVLQRVLGRERLTIVPFRRDGRFDLAGLLASYGLPLFALSHAPLLDSLAEAVRRSLSPDAREILVGRRICGKGAAEAVASVIKAEIIVQLWEIDGVPLPRASNGRGVDSAFFIRVSGLTRRSFEPDAAVARYLRSRFASGELGDALAAAAAHLRLHVVRSALWFQWIAEGLAVENARSVLPIRLLHSQFNWPVPVESQVLAAEAAALHEARAVLSTLGDLSPRETATVGKKESFASLKDRALATSTGRRWAAVKQLGVFVERCRTKARGLPGSEIGGDCRSLDLIAVSKLTGIQTRTLTDPMGPFPRLLETAIAELGLGCFNLRQAETEFMTIGDLQSAAERMLKFGNRPEQIAMSQDGIGALKRFAKSFECGEGTLAIALFGEAFEDLLKTHVRAYENAGTAANQRYLLRAWRQIYDTAVLERNLPDGFSEAIAELFKRSGLSVSQLAAKVKNRVSLDRNHEAMVALLKTWMKGASPTRYGLQIIDTLEAIFVLAPGTLVRRARFAGARLPARHFPPRPDGTPCSYNTRAAIHEHLSFAFYRTPETGWRDQIQRIMDEKIFNAESDDYRVRLRLLRSSPLPRLDRCPKLGLELDLLRAHRSVNGNSGLKRDDAWRDTTAKLRKQDVYQYFKVLAAAPDHPNPRSRGLGLRQEDLSLTLILMPRLMLRMMHIVNTVRNRGPNNSTVGMLRFFRMLLREETGFIRINPWLVDHIPDDPLLLGEDGTKLRDAAARNWAECCRVALKAYRDAEDSLERSNAITFTRDPRAQARKISSIFGRPIEAVKLFADALEHCTVRPNGEPPDPRDDDAPNRVWKLYYGRLAFVFVLRICQLYPLRPKHFYKMTYLPDNSGHLRWSAGGWHIQYPRAFFKNASSPALGPKHDKGARAFEVPNELDALVEDYVRYGRPLLLDGRPDHGFFLVTMSGNPYCDNTYGQRIRNLVRMCMGANDPKFLDYPELRAMRPYLIRHLTGKDAAVQDGVETAAALLLNTIDTCREQYADDLPDALVTRVQAKRASGLAELGISVPRTAQAIAKRLTGT